MIRENINTSTATDRSGRFPLLSYEFGPCNRAPINEEMDESWKWPIPASFVSVILLDHATSDPLSQALASGLHRVSVCTRGAKGALHRK